MKWLKKYALVIMALEMVIILVLSLLLYNNIDTSQVFTLQKKKEKQKEESCLSIEDEPPKNSLRIDLLITSKSKLRVKLNDLNDQELASCVKSKKDKSTLSTFIPYEDTILFTSVFRSHNANKNDYGYQLKVSNIKGELISKFPSDKDYSEGTLYGFRSATISDTLFVPSPPDNIIAKINTE